MKHSISPPSGLERAHGAFQRWLGDDYDLDALDAVLAAAAAEKLTGDPLWLLLISGSGNAKTETVQALTGAGALLTSTIASDAALLSGTSKRDKGKDATGGLLRRLGERGILVIKDFTSILSMHRDTRASLLAALREIHDGKWERNLGTDGGKTLSWAGRIAIVGATTTAWDRAHDVVASMGHRFVVLRVDSTIGRQAAGRRAIGNTGFEDQMRAHLAESVGAAIAAVNANDEPKLSTRETDRLLAAADLTTLCRTGVDYDYRGDVIDAHAPEMPTRFAKQLAQVVRGGVALGMCRDRALRLALRCARDSMPPLRLAILEDVAAHPGTRTPDVRQRLNKPRNTVDRQLQAMHMLGVLTCDEVEVGPKATHWHYSIAENINTSVLCVPDLSSHAQSILERQDSEDSNARRDISGTLTPEIMRIGGSDVSRV
jgi:hypothetical protein